jgi:hypothetical protein
MPYIPQKSRDKYDALINELAFKLNSMNSNDKIAGDLNYILFRLAGILCNESSGGRKTYARKAVVSSAMSEAQAEFRRRLMAPYEDEKIEINGDVEF